MEGSIPSGRGVLGGESCQSVTAITERRRACYLVVSDSAVSLPIPELIMTAMFGFGLYLPNAGAQFFFEREDYQLAC